MDSPFAFACKTITSRRCLVPAQSFRSHSGFSWASDGQVGRFSSSPALGSCELPWWPVGSAQKRDPESQGELLPMPRMTLFRWPCVSQAAEADRYLSISRSPGGLGGHAGRRAGCPMLTLRGQGSLCRRCVCVCVLVAQLCSTLCNPVHCGSPGSSVHGILQARIVEGVASSFSRGVHPCKYAKSHN